MASARQLIRTERLLDRLVASLLAIGTLGGLFATYSFLGEILQLHEALRTGDDTVENLDPGTALPTVYVLGGYALGFAVLFAVVAVLILRASPLGPAMLRAAVPTLLPAVLLAFFAGYIRYSEYVDAMPTGSRDPSYQSSIFGQIIGGGIGAVGVVGALLVVVGALVVRWFRPSADRGIPLGSSAAALNAAKILALAGTVVALLVPVAWVRPIGDGGDLPSEWSLLATLTGVLAVGALIAAGLAALARPGRLTFRTAALGALVVVASIEWAVTLWESFYADVAYGTQRIDGVAVPWTAAIACGLISGGLLTAAAVTLTLPGPVPEVDPAAPAVTRVTETPEERAARRVGEATPEPGWQAFPAGSPQKKRRKK